MHSTAITSVQSLNIILIDHFDTSVKNSVFIVFSVTSFPQCIQCTSMMSKVMGYKKYKTEILILRIRRDW